MDNEDDRDKDEEEKKGFVWYNDLRDLSEQACETVQQVSNCWSDYAGDYAERAAEELEGRYEPRERIYTQNHKINEISEKIEDLVNICNKFQHTIDHQGESLREEFEKDRAPMPLKKRIVNSILDDIPVTIFWFLVFGFFTLIIAFLS